MSGLINLQKRSEVISHFVLDKELGPIIMNAIENGILETEASGSVEKWNHDGREEAPWHVEGLAYEGFSTRYRLSLFNKDHRQVLKDRIGDFIKNDLIDITHNLSSGEFTRAWSWVLFYLKWHPFRLYEDVSLLMIETLSGLSHDITDDIIDKKYGDDYKYNHRKTYHSIYREIHDSLKESDYREYLEKNYTKIAAVFWVKNNDNTTFCVDTDNVIMEMKNGMSIGQSRFLLKRLLRNLFNKEINLKEYGG